MSVLRVSSRACLQFLGISRFQRSRQVFATGELPREVLLLRAYLQRDIGVEPHRV